MLWMLLIIISLLAALLFTGLEAALITANRFHIEVENKKGSFSHQLIGQFLEAPSRFVAAMLTGKITALVIFSAAFVHYASRFWSSQEGLNHWLWIGLAGLMLILVLGELLPRVLFSVYPNFMLKVLAVPAKLFFILLDPLARLVVFLARWLLGQTNNPAQVLTGAFEKQDMESYLRERSDDAPEVNEEEQEIQIFRNALAFNEQKARDFMVPRTEIVAIDFETPLAELRQVFIDSHLSKILVYRHSVDNIIGYVHGFELFKQPEDLKSILRPVSFIPESMSANEVLNLLIRDRRSLAVVLDEFGGTSGLITVEDVVEELFGEIDDEHDTEALLEQALEDGSYRFSARQEIDYLNERYDLELPEDDNYTTLGGLIIQHLERIPEAGEGLQVEDRWLEVEGVSNTKIETVKVLPRRP